MATRPLDDERRGEPGQRLLTGSQTFTLMKGVADSLAGRADIVDLETLSFGEIREALPAAEVDAAIVRGGFPELHAAPDSDAVGRERVGRAAVLCRARHGYPLAEDIEALTAEGLLSRRLPD